MKREIFITTDGSTSIHIPEWGESYHSKHGAIQEAQHVFIKNGFSCCNEKSISILEIGFGTGLNAFITFLEAKQSGQNIEYVGVEAYPVAMEEVMQMNYPEALNANEFNNVFKLFHEAEWNKAVTLLSNF
jgi:tRNA U34 5-methylaminomethyl-2-thiouridine-forming methyltransferase MnmC